MDVSPLIGPARQPGTAAFMLGHRATRAKREGIESGKPGLLTLAWGSGGH